MSTESKNDEKKSSENTTDLKDTWAIRPCDIYKDEYDDCTSIKARFHQYFINGENTNCTQWLTDYNNCVRYKDSNGNDINAGAAVIKSEEVRRQIRLRAHYANDTWDKRKQPPEDWAKPLPEWFEKRNKNTFLELKQMELDGRAPKTEETTYCVIM